MRKKTFKNPAPTRPGEFVALFYIQLNTLEGPAYVYMAVDAYTGHLFNLGIESSQTPEYILKYVYLLTENVDFSDYFNNGFTLILEEYEELNDPITRIIKNVNGTVQFDKLFFSVIIGPVLLEFLDLMKEDDH